MTVFLIFLCEGCGLSWRDWLPDLPLLQREGVAETAHVPVGEAAKGEDTDGKRATRYAVTLLRRGGGRVGREVCKAACTTRPHLSVLCGSVFMYDSCWMAVTHVNRTLGLIIFLTSELH